MTDISQNKKDILLDTYPFRHTSQLYMYIPSRFSALIYTTAIPEPEKIFFYK